MIKHKIQNLKPSDREVIEKLSLITGKQFRYLLKRLGINVSLYASKVDPPYQTRSGITNYYWQDAIPFKLIKPLINEYDPHFLLAILKQKFTIE